MAARSCAVALLVLAALLPSSQAIGGLSPSLQYMFMQRLVGTHSPNSVFEPSSEGLLAENVTVNEFMESMKQFTQPRSLAEALKELQRLGDTREAELIEADAQSLWHPEIVSDKGPIRGLHDDDHGVDVFLGVPFAAPPTGDNRFRRPQPVPAWAPEVLEATRVPPMCPQLKLSELVPGHLGQEDCLYLNVYRPANADPNAPLPVMVWFFGGGFVLGDGWEFGFYDGREMAKRYGVILVTLNYRVEAFGFAALSELAAEDPDGSTGNYALMDQRAALEWVQRNAGAFGGDSERVTIFGESAGAFSVCAHLASEQSHGLFQRAIMQSGTCRSAETVHLVSEADRWSRKHLKRLGCGGTGAELLACARRLPAHKLLRALSLRLLPEAGDFPLAHSLMPWGFAIDNSAAGLRDYPETILASGKGANVPLMAGTTTHDGSIFVPTLLTFVPGLPVLPLPGTHTLRHALHHVLNQDGKLVESTVKLYPSIDYWFNFYARASQVLTDFLFGCATKSAAQVLSASASSSASESGASGAAAAAAGVWVYRFDHRLSWPEFHILGTYHSSDIPFVFHNEWPPVLHKFWRRDFNMARIMGQYWTNFAKHGDPNGPSLPVWPVFGADRAQMVLTEKPKVERNARARVCDHFHGVPMYRSRRETPDP